MDYDEELRPYPQPGISRAINRSTFFGRLEVFLAVSGEGILGDAAVVALAPLLIGMAFAVGGLKAVLRVLTPSRAQR